MHKRLVYTVLEDGLNMGKMYCPIDLKRGVGCLFYVLKQIACMYLLLLDGLDMAECIALSIQV